MEVEVEMDAAELLAWIGSLALLVLVVRGQRRANALERWREKQNATDWDDVRKCFEEMDERRKR